MSNIRFLHSRFATRVRNTCAMSVALVLSAIAAGASARAAEPSDYLSSNGKHHLFRADASPGVIGYGRQLGRGPIAGYFQPVAFSGPGDTQFSLSQGGAFAGQEDNLMAGLQVGRVYRFRITGIPNAAGAELYPSIELIDRTYPPPGLATTYPVQIVLDEDDLVEALRGRMVTKVIYLEDPQTAPGINEQPNEGRTLDVAEYQDPLHEADRVGRPIAVVRIGSLAPPTSAALIPQFFFGDPTWAPIFQPEEVRGTP